jgi:hypothetical protein
MTYCKTYDGSSGPTRYVDPAECIVWDEGDAVNPIDQSAAIFITTRVTITTERRLVCLGLLCIYSQTHTVFASCQSSWSHPVGTALRPYPASAFFMFC